MKKEYNVIIKLDREEMKAKIMAENWEEVCDYIFGKIEIIPENEEDIEELDD